MAARPPDGSTALHTDQLCLEFPSKTPAQAAQPVTPPPPRPKTKSKKAARGVARSRNGPSERHVIAAETLAKQQREISVSEFFAKNRHLLGFDNKRKALLTTVKEAVDNSLDACEEAGILPDLDIRVEQTGADRFRVTVRDNGPGIVKQQIPPVFGKLLYGSKFHRLKMARGQQGIGISAAGMYGLITTAKPIKIVSRTSSRSHAHLYKLAIDTKKNRPDIIADDTIEVDWAHGTEVSIELAATYNKGRQSVDEYLELTAIANPHAEIIYHTPDKKRVEFPRGTETLPAETKEIKPHPYGIELGTMMKMLKETSAKKLGQFLTSEFSRVSPVVAKKVCIKADLTTATWVSAVGPGAAEKLYNTLQEVRLLAPSTNCLAPMGAEAILSGLLKEIKAEFYTASTRPPSVYRGNPFQIEVGLAYGGELGADMRDGDSNGDGHEPVHARVIRFANRVPLLYQQSSCATFKAVVETKWSNYGLSQSSGSLPRAPVIIMIHMASVWVPFISEGKEAIADYDEIRKEARLALAECGRRLHTLLRRKRKKATYSKRRDVFTRYIDEVVESTRAITAFNKDGFRKSLVELSKVYTAQADMEFDEHGKVVRKKKATGNDMGLTDTIVVDRELEEPAPQSLFEVDGRNGKKKPRGKVAKRKKRRR